MFIFEGGAVGIGCAEKLSEIADDSTLFTTISDLNYWQKALYSPSKGNFNNNCAK